MSTTPKNIDTALAQTLAIVKIFEALESGSQITDEMIAATGDTPPPEVQQAIAQINLLHSKGINKNTIDKVPSGSKADLDAILSEIEEIINSPCDCPNCVAEREAKPSPSKRNMFSKDSANFMSDEAECEVVEGVTKDIMKQWERNPALSNSFPTILACAVLIAHSRMAVDARGEGHAILAAIDKVRQMIADDLGLEG